MTDTFTFNLIDQPWIPCLTINGSFEEVSLRDLLAHAHALRTIHCETPIMNAAIMPVVLALLHRVFSLDGRRAWDALWSQGQFPIAQLDTYFEQWYERFDLFHPERPFYQTYDDRVKTRSVIHLIQSIANTGTLFTHADESVGLQLTASEAARHLITAQRFRTAGLSGLDEKFTDSAFARGVIFWAEGPTLFETLMLNLLSYPDESFFVSTSRDAPAWEMSDPFEKRYVPNGYLDYLTWQTNRIMLIPSEDDDETWVRMMTVAPGLNIGSEVRSPQKRYIKKSKDGEDAWSFLYFNDRKALWRDFHSILPQNGENIRPPAVVTWLSHLMLEDDYPLRLIATGMLADQAKVIFYRQELLPFPVMLLKDDNKFSLVNQAVEYADMAVEQLRGALNLLADNVLMRGGDLKPDSGTRSNLLKQWDALGLYWAQLEPHFWTFIYSLAAGEETAPQAWQTVITLTAKEALSMAERMAGDTPWALRGGVIASRILQAGLNKIFNQ